MERKPDIKVTFHLYGKDEVKEDEKIYARRGYASSGYRPQHKIEENKLADGIHEYEQEKVKPGENAEGTITFLSPENYPHSLWIDKKIDIQEGERIIGYAIIKEIFNKSLEKREDKIICKCESTLTLEDLQEASEHIPSIYINLLFGMSIIAIIIATIANLLYGKTLLWWIEYFCICELTLAITLKIKLKEYVKSLYENEQKKSPIDSKYINEFYDNYFIRSSEHITRKIEYSKIKKTIETTTNFYLQYDNMTFIIQKSKCDSKTIDFIREKTQNNYNNKIKEKESNKTKKTKHSKNKKLIKSLMIILFIATLLSLYGGLVTSALITEGKPTADFAQNIWVFWLWLPIPLLSIVLGFKYKKEGIKCTKNIIAGFIMAFLLLIYGSFSLLPSFEVDYKEIYQYSNILNIELPKDGKLISYDVDYEEDFGTVTIYQSNYEDNDISELEEQIKNSKNWLSGNELKSELKVFIPAMMPIADYRYFSIYNKTTNEYNTMPKETGKYKIYVMMLDKVNKQLEINEFEYSYTN